MNNVIRDVRMEKDLSQNELAEAIGISRKALSNIETNKCSPSVEIAIKISEMLKVAVEKLFIMPQDASKHRLYKKIKYIDLFCGIGGFRYAANQEFKKIDIKGECVFSSDIDAFACKSYAANFKDMPCGDITKINASDIPDFDLLFGGFPCQAFSIIGKMKGFADKTRGTLFFEIARIIREKRPRGFVLENVKQLATHNNGETFKTILSVLRDELGYYVDYKVLNALDYGLPQKRERIIIVGSTKPFIMEWPAPVRKRKPLEDILEKNVASKYYASKEIVKKRKAMHHSKYLPAIWHENKAGNISSYPYSCALRAGASYNYLLVNGERRLTPREMLRLQGFPDSFKMVVSDCQLRKQAGNAVPVNMIKQVLDKFIPLVFVE